MGVTGCALATVQRAVVLDIDGFARMNVAIELEAERIHGDALGCNHVLHPCWRFPPAEHYGPNPKGVAKTNYAITRNHGYGRVGAAAAAVYAGDRYPYHGNFVPGDANSIGYEDLKVIEDYEYLSSVAAGRQHDPGFREAINYVSVQDALLRSWKSERWEDVTNIASS